MEMLRVLMYDTSLKNPDARFITMMRDFTKTYAGRNASTEDFQKMVEKYAGESMDWFFHAWVYGTDIPSYDFSYQAADAGAGQTVLTMTITQSGVPETFQMRLPVYLGIKSEMRFLGTIGVVGSKLTKAGVKLPFRPDSVVLDPNRSILATSIRQ